MDIIAQSAIARRPAAAGLDLNQELIVTSVVEQALAEYQGTRAAIEAEGIIPEGMLWPIGFENIYWKSEGLRFWLARFRPEGIKGSRAELSDMDWWMLRINPLEFVDYSKLHLRLKARELVEAIYYASDEGRAQSLLRMQRYEAAQDDRGWQVFKNLIPGIRRPPRGRPSRSAKSMEGVHHV